MADDFLPSIRKLLAQSPPPDHIIIETSGLALPKPLVRAFNWPEIRSRVTVDGVVTVVDAPAVIEGRFAASPDAVQLQREAAEMLDHDSPLEEVFEDQLLSADLILLNKTDLIDNVGITEIRQEVSNAISSAVKMVTASHGAIDPNVLLGIGATVEDKIEKRRSHHDGEEEHDHDDFESFVVKLGAVDPIDLENSITTAVKEHDILRIKGFIHESNKDLRQVIDGAARRARRDFGSAQQHNERQQCRKQATAC